MKPATQVLIERYQKHLYAIAFNICRNQQDAEDVVQDTFIQYHTYKKEFDTEEHIRAWLIRVAINKAKNINLSFWRQKGVPFQRTGNCSPSNGRVPKPARCRGVRTSSR